MRNGIWGIALSEGFPEKVRIFDTTLRDGEQTSGVSLTPEKTQEFFSPIYNLQSFMHKLFESFPKQITLYDVTLRDGNQTPGVSFTLEDKLEAAQKLDEFGVDYIELGMPSSSLTDITAFKKIKEYELKHAKIAAFGRTMKHGNKAYNDPELELMLKTEADVLTLVGKSSIEHVKRVLKITPEQNLSIIGESVDYLKSHGYTTFFDAEHYFIGFSENPEYALESLKAAKNADVIILCDTSAGFIPETTEFVTKQTLEASKLNKKIFGIHCHNDSGTVIENAIAALKCGVTQIQGGFCGLGERTGNVPWDELLPTLEFKYNVSTVGKENLRKLKMMADYFSRISGFSIPPNAPYIGDNSFVHVGGMHTDAILKYPRAYEHIDPALVGNKTSFTLSDQAGSASILAASKKFGYEMNKKDPAVKRMLEVVKSRRHFTDTQLYLLLAKEVDGRPLPFELLDYQTIDGMRMKPTTWVRVRINGKEYEEGSSGVGPVHSFDLALRKVLSMYLTPEIEKVKLTSYHVTIYREERGTAATTEVSIGFNANGEKGSVIGESDDILKASVPPLAEIYSYVLYRLNKKSK